MKDAKTMSESRFFLFAVIPLALLIMLMTSSHAWQDGATHYWNVFHLSNQLMGIDGEDEWKARGEDISLYNRMKTPKGMAATGEMFEDFHFFSEDDSMDYMVTRPMHMTFYSILSYLPQVTGVTIGRLFGLSGIMTLLLGRLTILAVFILFCYRAIQRTPVGKSVFLVLSLLPFTILIASSFSYDVMVYVVTLNFISCILSLRNRMNPFVLIETFVFVFLLGAVKAGGYLILLPMVCILFGIGKDAVSRRKQVMIVSGLILTGLLSLLLFDVIIPAGQELFQFGDPNSEEILHPSYAFTHPFSYGWMLLKTYAVNVGEAVITFGKTETGWLNIVLMGIYVIIASQEKREFCFKKSEYICMGIVLFLTVFSIPISMLGQTGVDADTLGGLRARYYLPVMPIVLLLLSGIPVLRKLQTSGAERELQTPTDSSGDERENLTSAGTSGAEAKTGKPVTGLARLSLAQAGYILCVAINLFAAVRISLL